MLHPYNLNHFTHELKTHNYIPVNSKLTQYIAGIWEVYGERNITETILPQGIIEIIFNFADSMTATQRLNQKTIQPARCFVQGLNTEALTVSYPGKHHLFGVRLKPHMVKNLLGIISSELKDNIIDLSLVNADLNNLWNELGEATDFEGRVKIVERNFPMLEQEDCPRTKRLSDLFYSDNVQDFQSLDTLAQQVYYSSRHLNRKAQSVFGVTAEELITYKKFLYSTNLIHGENLSMTEIAYQSGFYDQAHFSRTFKSFAGLTPRQYKLRKSHVPFHLYS